MGYVQDVSTLLSQATVYFQPSQVDSLPMAVIEAMAHGVPVVVSRVLGHVDIVESGSTGFLFAVDSPQEAAEKINTLITNHHLWKTIRANAYHQANEKFSATRMAKETEALYLRLRA